MAFNLLQIAKFINGERPSADKFNSIFTFIDSKIRNTNISLGSNISDESTKVSIYDENTQTNILFDTSKKGFKQKQDNEFVLNARKRHIDLASITNVIGSASNLNPLMLNETQTIKETIPAGVTEYNIKYPIPILDLLIELGNLNSPSFQRYVGNTMALVVDGDYHVGYRNKFSVNEIDFTTEIIWNKPTEIATELEYTFNPGKISNSMLSYQGASYNTIPDLNTPKEAISVFDGDQEYFYNLKFSERDSDGYVTISLPFVKYVSLNVENQETAELNSGNPTFHNQIKLPEIFKMIQTESEVSEFLIPKGLLYLVHFDNPSEKLIDNDYIYVNETTIKVSGISDDLLNCLLSEPGTQNYKQMHLLTVGTDITTSILDIRNKLSSHNHDGSFGEEKIHINNIQGIYEYRSIFNSRVYYPTKLQGHIATQYLHRDGYRYNSDSKNKDNAILGDLLLKGDSSNSSFKLFFGENVSFTELSRTGKDLFPGYSNPNPFADNYNFSWLGLCSVLGNPDEDISFNIQGSGNSNVSILSNRDLNIVSKDKIVSVIKDVNSPAESLKITRSSYDFPTILNEASAQIQKENINANINQSQISLINDNNQINLFNLNNTPPTISILSENKTISYSEFPDQTGRTVGLNSIQLISESGEINNEIRTFTQGTNTSLFQKKEEYLSDKRESASKDFFKKEIPTYKKEYERTPPYFFGTQDGTLENTNVVEINNATQKKEGCFVYVIQHLVDDRNDPNFKFFMIPPAVDHAEPPGYLFSYEWKDRVRPMIDKKHIYNATYDFVRNQKLLNRESLYDTESPIENKFTIGHNYVGDLMHTNPNTGFLEYDYTLDGERHFGPLNLMISNDTGSGSHYNNWFDGSSNSDRVILRRFYKHNPFPCSKEYINQHFYIYGFNTTMNTIHRLTTHILGNPLYNSEQRIREDDFNNYYGDFGKTRTLTKMVWKKFWLKEDLNSNTFDFEELLSFDEELYNNDKYILVNQGYLIDCGIPPGQKYSIETYNWGLQSLSPAEAMDINYNRVCEFYEVDKTSNFYDLYPNWIAGNKFYPTVTVSSSEWNVQAIDAIITGGLPFTRHGNLQSENDYQNFFTYFKKHEFEDDNTILYFGKGFVNFHEMIRNYDGELKYDIVLDNHWRDGVELNRTLNIKLKNKSYTDRNYKSKENIKIIFSDFNGENLNLINEFLPVDKKLHDSFIYDAGKGPASSVTQYLWKIWRERKEWPEYDNDNTNTILPEVFRNSLDFKLYSYHTWLFGVILKLHNDVISFNDQFKLFNDIPLNNLTVTGSAGVGQPLDIKESNSFYWKKHLSFKKSFPFKNQINLFGQGEGDLNTSNFFSATSNTKPRTFFTYINIDFDKNSFDVFYQRKLNNQIYLKTNGSSSNYLNSNNLTICLKNTIVEEFYGMPLTYFNIGPIQGFYDIEIDRFTNNERSYWSAAEHLLLKEKFGCSLFNIKVNVDLNFCFVC